MSNMIYSSPASKYNGNNAKSDLNEIAWLKNVYTNGSDSDKAWASNEAQKYYSNLQKNGFGHLADTMKGLSAGDAYNYSKGYVPDYNGQEFADSYRANTNKAIDKQLAATVAGYEAQKTGVNRQYDSSAKELYAGYLNTSKKLPQQLEAQGITGGASESANLKMQNNYMQNLYSQEMARNQALSQIDAAIASATANAEAQKANAENTYTQMAYDISRDTRDYYANERYKNTSLDQNQKQIDNSFYLSQRGLDLNERQFDTDKEQIAIQNAVNAAQMGNFDLLANMWGITPKEAYNRYKTLIQFQDDPNGLNAMQVRYNVGKPYYNNYGYYVNPDEVPEVGKEGNNQNPFFLPVTKQ